jgi:hypothetical protein
MNPLNYIISTNGLGIAVGIVGDKQQAQQDATLAENIYGFNHSDHLFDHLIYMPSLQSFKKFLVMKEYFKIWDEYWARNKVAGSRNKNHPDAVKRFADANIMQFTRRAIKRAKLTIDSNVQHENFMQKISARNQTYSIGGYQDEAEEE